MANLKRIIKPLLIIGGLVGAIALGSASAINNDLSCKYRSQGYEEKAERKMNESFLYGVGLMGSSLVSVGAACCIKDKKKK